MTMKLAIESGALRKTFSGHPTLAPSQQLPCLQIIQVVVTMRLSDSGLTNRARNRRERRSLRKCLPYLGWKNEKTDRGDAHIKVGGNIRTPKGKIAAPRPHINNVRAPPVDDNHSRLKPPSLWTVDPARCHRVSKPFALGDQLTIALFAPAKRASVDAARVVPGAGVLASSQAVGRSDVLFPV
jgi:hypothetical protein